MDTESDVSTFNFDNFVRWSGFAVGVYLVLFAFMVIYGWYAKELYYIQFFSDALPVQYNSAILFLLTGLAIIFYNFDYVKLVSVLTGVNILFSAIIGAQFLFDVDLSIDQFFIKPFMGFKEYPLGRVSLTTAICFILSNLALFMLAHYRTKPIYGYFIGLLASIVLAISGIVFLSFLSGFPGINGWFKWSYMAILTSLGFIPLGTVLLLNAWRTLVQKGSKENIAWFSIPICLFMFTMTFSCWLAIQSDQNSHIRGLESMTPEPVEDDFIRQIKDHQHAIQIIILLQGLFATSLVAGIFFYAQRARKRTFELEESINQLNRARNTLITQDKLASLGVLIAGIAHEIKNPLGFIINFSELGVGIMKNISQSVKDHYQYFKKEEQTELDEEIKNLESNLLTILEQGNRANNTVQRMLMHARGKSNQAVPTDLHALLDEYLKLSYQGIRAQIPGFNVKIEKEFACPYGNVKVFPEDICRVFLNIFNNAYYALSIKKKNLGESFSPVISVKTLEHEGKFEIRIKDNGYGIPTDIQNKVFTPFFTTKPPGQGTGLGLSLSRNIVVDEHGGSLTFETDEGTYTEFVISIPIHRL